jgi:hypothetical protein
MTIHVPADLCPTSAILLGKLAALAEEMACLHITVQHTSRQRSKCCSQPNVDRGPS